MSDALRAFWEFCTDPVTLGGLILLALAGALVLGVVLAIVAGVAALVRAFSRGYREGVAQRDEGS